MAGNRSHGIIDTFPPELKEAVNKAIVNGMTYQDIANMINDAGQKISIKTVAKYGKNFTAKLESITRAKEQAKSIIETSAGLKLDLAEAATTTSLQLLFDMLINTQNGEVDKNTIAAMRAAASLERSAVSREKLKLQYDKGVYAAGEKIKAVLADELAGNAELAEKLNKIVDDITYEMTKPQS